MEGLGVLLANIEKKLKNSNRYPKLISKFIYDVSIKNKLYTIIVVITIFPIILYSIFQYQTSMSYIYASQQTFLNSSSENIKVVIDSSLRNLMKISDDIAYNRTINQLMVKKENDTTFDIIQRNVKIKEHVMPLIDKQIYNMYAETPNVILGYVYVNFYLKNQVYTSYASSHFINKYKFDEIVQTNNDFKYCYDKLSSTNQLNVWKVGTQSQEGGLAYNKNTISINTLLNNLRGFEELGVLSVQCDRQVFTTILNDFNSNNEFVLYLVDGQNNVVASSDSVKFDTAMYQKLTKQVDFSKKEESFHDFVFEDEGYLVKQTTLSANDWKLITLHSVKELDKQKRNQIHMVISLCMGCLLFAFVIMLLLSRSITVRLKELMYRMSNVKTYLIKKSIHISGKDEIGMVDVQFVDMLNQINALMKENDKIQQENNFVQAELLQQQINPHLLYNSLSAIRYLSLYSKIQDINQITENLIGFYKLSLSSGNTIIALKEELDICAQYIKLISKVYDIDIVYEFSIDEKIQESICLKLILQPIVENAVLHGFKKLSKTARLEISAHCSQEGMCIEVRDNGRGMPTEKATKLGDTSGIIKGFGLFNVNKRIKLFYGEQYGLSVESEEGVGTVVTIVLPNPER